MFVVAYKNLLSRGNMSSGFDNDALGQVKTCKRVVVSNISVSGLQASIVSYVVVDKRS